jgi:hypothetical protein
MEAVTLQWNHVAVNHRFNCRKQMQTFPRDTVGLYSQPIHAGHIFMASIFTIRQSGFDLAHVVAMFRNMCFACIVRSRMLAIAAPLTSVDTMHV